MQQVIIISVIILVILVFFSLPRGLCGFWVVSDEFANSAGIDQLCIAFGDLDSKRRTHGYIILKREGKLILNEPIIVQFRMRWPFSARQKIKFLDFNVEGMPNEFTVECDSNKIKMYSGETLWGIFFKDNQLSEICKKKQEEKFEEKDFD